LPLGAIAPEPALDDLRAPWSRTARRSLPPGQSSTVGSFGVDDPSSSNRAVWMALTSTLARARKHKSASVWNTGR